MVPVKGSYLNETDYFEENWQESFWGSNYKKLLAVKNTYDPDGLFLHIMVLAVKPGVQMVLPR